MKGARRRPRGPQAATRRLTDHENAAGYRAMTRLISTMSGMEIASPIPPNSLTTMAVQ